jgi:hypothetical protein
MERDQSIIIFFMKLAKNYILCIKTDARFYGPLEPSVLSIYWIEKLNPVYAQYTV